MSGTIWVIASLVGAWCAFSVMLRTMHDKTNAVDARWLCYWRTAAYVFCAATLAFSVASLATSSWTVPWQAVLVLIGGAQVLLIQQIALIKRSSSSARKSEKVRWRAF